MPSVVLRGRRAGTRSEPELGAAAAAVNVDGGGANPLDGETREGGGGGGGGGQELQQQQVDPAPPAAERPQVARRKLRRGRAAFTQLQLQELEMFFRRSRYPDLFER